MKFRGLLVGLIVLAALVGLLYWSNRQSAAKSTSTPSSVPSSPKILTLNQSDIIKVEVKKKESEALVLSKNGSGAWQITAPQEYNADSSAISSLLSTLASLSPERVVEGSGDFQAYGLAPPTAELVITENGNKSQRLLVGDETPTHNGVYAALTGDPRVFTIANYEKTNLDKGLNDFRDKRFLTIESDKINRLEVSAKHSDLEFDRYKDHWQIVKPSPMRADSAPIAALLSTLTAARIDLTQPVSANEKAARSFAKAEVVGRVRVMSDTGTQELDVRKIGKDYYAKSSVLDLPYKVSDDLAQQLNKPLEDFRNKKLFDFGYTDPAKIEFDDGAKSYFLTRNRSDWWGADGKKLELASAYSFLDKLRDLKADKFVESGFGTPEIQITVTPGNGAQAERVALSKSGAAYVGMRISDATLYQVDSKAVEELKRAAFETRAANK